MAEILGSIERIRLDSIPNLALKIYTLLTGGHRFMCFRLSSARVTFVAATALGCVLSACIGAPQAQAQFVCGGSGTGAEPQGADGAVGTGVFSVACGTNATAANPTTTAVGFNAGLNAVAGGTQNSFFGERAGAGVNGSRTSAFGVVAGLNATGDGNSAFGNLAGITVTGNNNSAFGFQAGENIVGSNNVAIGNSAGSGTTASPLAVSNTIAIGNGTTALADGAVAIGSGAQATRQNQFAFGTATNTYTMAGITSVASQTAQSGALQLVTTDANGNLAGRTASSLGLASSSDIAGINSQIGGINSQITAINSHLGLIDTELNDLGNRVNRVGAASAALAGLHPNPRAKGDNHLSVAYGNYRGESAIAAGYFRNIGNQTLFSAGVSTAGANNWSSNAGLTFSW